MQNDLGGWITAEWLDQGMRKLIYLEMVCENYQWDGYNLPLSMGNILYDVSLIILLKNT